MLKSTQMARARAGHRLPSLLSFFVVALVGTLVLLPLTAAPALGEAGVATRMADSSVYSQAVLADSPWAYWKFDEASGTTAQDSSGNNRPMTIFVGDWQSPPLWGRPGPAVGDRALELRGQPNSFSQGDRVVRGVSSSDFVDNFTAELWVYPTLSDNLQFLIGRGNSIRYGASGWSVLLNTNNRIELWLNGGPAIRGPNLPLNTWSYVAVSRSAGVWTIYENGAPYGSSTVTASGGTGIFFAGDGLSGGGFNLRGKIADGAFYAAPLSSDQIQAHYDAVPVVDLPPAETYGPTVSPACGSFACNPSATQAEPVNTATGSYVTEATDLALAGIGVPFILTRTYNSADLTSGPLGQGWTHSLNASLTIRPGGATARNFDGQQLNFTLNGDGSFRPGRGGRATLTSITGGYELVRADQVHLRFDSQGRLTSERDRNGKGLALTYGGNGKLASVVDSANRSISFAYNGSNLLASVTLPGGRRVSYAYTGGRLSSVTDVRAGTTSYTYDGGGRLNKITDQSNHDVVTNTYGSDGRITQQVDALGHTTTFSWDATSQTATMTDARSNAWQDVYFNNVLQRRIDPLGNTTSYEYDHSLNPTKVTDERGNATTMTWDSRGNLLTATAPAPLSYQETFTYDSLNDLLTHTDGRGNTTSYGHDSAGNLTSVNQPGSVVTQLGRDPAGTGLITSLTDPRGKTTTFGYDSAGNLTTITSPLSEQTTIAYDSSGRITTLTDPRGKSTTYTYNAADRVLTETDPLSHATTFAYNPVGNLTSITDAKNHQTSYGYNAANKLTSVTAPDQSVTGYAYDAVGNLTSRTDANNHTTNYGYNAANRLTSMAPPIGQSWTYTHDANGNRLSTVAPNGTTTYGYDALNRLISIGYSDATPAVSYSYDGNGNRTSMNDGAGTETYGFNALNELTSATRGTNVFSYAYDAAGDVTQRTYPDGTIADYAYDDDGRLATVTSGGQTTSYAYDSAGNLLTTTLPAGNGYVETRSYDNASRLIEVKNAAGASVLSDFAYTLDAVGNPTTVAQSGATPGTTTYTYDALDRLTGVCSQASCPGGSDPFIRWTYDSVGNRLTEARPSGTTSYTYNAGDQLTQAGTTSYSYDGNGNETTAGSQTYAYDLANRLVTSSDGTTTTTYGYDGDGTRLSVTSGGQTTNELWDVNFALPQLALEQDGSGGLLRRYLYGADALSMTTPGGAFYYHHDALGSTTNLSSEAGAVEWTYSYEPFGAIQTETQNDPAAPANALKFTSQHLDSDTNLYHLRARQYDPASGRFLQTDPVPNKLSNPYIASYAYANDLPTLLTDPSGMSGMCLTGFCWAKHGVQNAVSTGERLGRWAVQHPDIIVEAAAVTCVVVTATACLPLGIAAAGTNLATSAYKNRIGGEGPNYGRFTGDFVLNAVTFGGGSLVGAIVRNEYYVVARTDRALLSRLAASEFFLTDLGQQGLRGELGSSVGQNEK